MLDDKWNLIEGITDFPRQQNQDVYFPRQGKHGEIVKNVFTRGIMVCLHLPSMSPFFFLEAASLIFECRRNALSSFLNEKKNGGFDGTCKRTLTFNGKFYTFKI